MAECAWHECSNEARPERKTCSLECSKLQRAAMQRKGWALKSKQGCGSEAELQANFLMTPRASGRLEDRWRESAQI